MTATVLYIDDKPELPPQIEEVLAQAGYQLIHTSDPHDAARIVRKRAPVLVLTEVLFPDSDGFENIEEMAQVDGGPRVPVVVVTRGERTPELYGRALELGVEEFICKPLTRAQVLEAVLAYARVDPSEKAGVGPSIPAAAARIAGELALHPLPEILGRLHRAGASGVLSVKSGTRAASIQMRNGSPVEVERHRDVQPIADFLLETRRIDAAQYTILVDQLMARVAGAREILLGMEAISESGLVAANYEQAREVILDMCRWSPGQYAFVPGQRLEVKDKLDLNHNPIQLVLAGLSRLSKQTVEQVIETHRNDYVSLSAESQSRLGEAVLTPEQSAAASALTGDRTLAEVAAAEPLDARTLYKLYALCAVELDEFPVLLLDQELNPVEIPTKAEREIETRSAAEVDAKVKVEVETDPRDAVDLDPQVADPSEDEIEIEIEAVPKPAPMTSLPTSRPRPSASETPIPDHRIAATPERPAIPITPHLGAVADKIDEIADRLESEDDFGLFDIDATARDAEVHTAYSNLLSHLRPELIPEDLEELRALADKLRSRIGSAYQRVRTEDLRRAFSGLRKKKRSEVAAPSDGSRAVEAENWFRTGEGFLVHEDFKQAGEAFGMALHLDPEQGDYAAHLGYALYRSNPGNSIIRREALEHVAKGVKLAPHHEKPLLFLSRIFRETGNEEMAEKILRRALKFNPDSPALIQETCVVGDNSSKSKGKGFLSRLRKR